MRTRKAHAANLENKRTIFFEFGCIIALAAILLSLNFKSYEKSKLDLNFGSRILEQEEMTAITQQEQPPPPPAPTQQTSIFKIVENESEEAEDEIIINVEADQDTKIEEYFQYTPPEIEETETGEEEMVFVIVESMPCFPGGDSARIQYLNENIRYPATAREANIQGTVYVSFVVEKNGQISSVDILRGIDGGCDEEAIRVIKNMPRWIPGKQRNMPVRVQFNMPIKFKLI